MYSEGRRLKGRFKTCVCKIPLFRSSAYRRPFSGPLSITSLSQDSSGFQQLADFFQVLCLQKTFFIFYVSRRPFPVSMSIEDLIRDLRLYKILLRSSVYKTKISSWVKKTCSCPLFVKGYFKSCAFKRIVSGPLSII